MEMGLEQGLHFLIVGLGNPGGQYANTRHNLGFMVVDKVAQRHGIVWKKEAGLLGITGRGKVEGLDCHLLKPITFMNQSGQAVALVKRYYRVPLDHILLISDEIAFPLGKMRLSERGSCGGHRGLESVENSLGTRHYARLRIGIGDRQENDLADYVLSEFQQEEQKLLIEVLEQAAIAVENWIKFKEADVNDKRRNSSL